MEGDAQDHRGINIVDLMMWLVIAALLLAAALQGIGYYKQAANVYLMQDEVTSVIADIHAAAAMNDGKIDEALVNQVLTDHNAAHPNDDIVVSYGSVTANAAGLASDSGYGFERSSAITATSPSDVTYLRASSDSVQSAYVVYFFSPTRTFQQGLTTVSKIRIDNGGFGDVTTPGTTQPTTTAPTDMADPASAPTPSATTTSAAPSPTATATPTPTATTASPTSTATATPTATQTATATATPTPTPLSAIETKYNAINGPVVLGTAKIDETALPSGAYRDYQNGAIVTSSSGTFVIKGVLRDKWIASGKDYLAGYPTADETNLSGGLSQLFTKGALVWSSASGAHHSTGAIRSYWLQWGAETGRMKYPTTDLVCGLAAGGCKQEYQGGAMYWSPATGAFDIGGAFLPTWRNNYGAESGSWGYPTSGEYWVGSTGTRQNFQNGHYLTWNASTGALAAY